MAAAPRISSARKARPAPRHAGRGRPDRQEAAGRARAPDDPRRARVPAASVRARGARARDLRPVRRGRGGDRRRGAERPCPARPPAPARQGPRGRRLRGDHGGLVQPGVAEGPPPARHPCPPSRQPEGERVHGPLLRRERCGGDRRLCARLPGQRGDHGQEAARNYRQGARARPRRGRSAARCAQIAGGAPRPFRRAGGAPPAGQRGAGRAGAEAACLRRVARAPGRAGTAPRGPRRGAGAGARRAGRSRGALPRRPSVRADAEPGSRDLRDRRRPRR